MRLIPIGWLRGNSEGRPAPGDAGIAGRIRAGAGNCVTPAGGMAERGPGVAEQADSYLRGLEKPGNGRGPRTREIGESLRRSRRRRRTGRERDSGRPSRVSSRGDRNE